MKPIIIESVESVDSVESGETETLNSPIDSPLIPNDKLAYSSSKVGAGLTLQKIYQLSQSVNSSINSGIYAVTGMKLNQKRLILSFLFTLLKDFALAYTVRGSLKLIPKLLKMLQLLKIDIVGLLKESFGKESAKFGLFISLFFSSYKVSEKIISHWRGPSSWLAGAVASLSFFVMRGEDKSFRWSLSQYVAVRAVQCLYNHFIRVHPHLKSMFYYGDVALFSFSSAQLMYGYFVRPGSLDPDYIGFVRRLTRTDNRIVKANRNFLRSTTPIVGSELIDLALLFEQVHGLKPSQLPLELSSPLLNNESLNCFPCSSLHYNEFCLQRILNVWLQIFKQVAPMYFSLHLVPSLLFKSKHFIKNPFHELLHTLRNSVQSSSFLASCGAIFQSLLCTSRQFLPNFGGDWKYYYWLIGLVAGTGILIEKKPRRSELALYILPKALQGLYRLMLNRNLIIRIPKGEYLLFSVSITVLMNYYKKEPEAMTPLVSRIFKRFL